MTSKPADIGEQELAQKGCVLEGMTLLLSQTPGDFRVVLYADADCANLVPRSSRAVDPTRFYCTNLGEQDLIIGTARARLEQAVLAVDGAAEVSAIFVVGSCVTSLIGDDVSELAARLGEQTRAPLIPVDMQAFRLSGQAEIIERFTRHLGALAATPARGDGVVNLLGYPEDDHGELEEVLEALGAPVNVRLAPGSPLERWGGLRHGRLNVASDRRLFRTLLQTERTDRGTPWLEVAPPYGLAASEALYRSVAGALEEAGLAGPARRLDEVMSARRGELVDRLSGAQERWEGQRLLYHIGARKDFTLPTVVREGFAPLGWFSELGFSVELAFQGAPEPASRRRIAGVLERYDVDLPFHVLPDRISLTRLLREGSYAAVCCADSLHEEVARTGVPHLPQPELRSGFGGARWMLDWVDGKLRKAVKP